MKAKLLREQQTTSTVKLKENKKIGKEVSIKYKNYES